MSYIESMAKLIQGLVRLNSGGVCNVNTLPNTKDQVNCIEIHGPRGDAEASVEYLVGNKLVSVVSTRKMIATSITILQMGVVPGKDTYGEARDA